MQLPFHRRRAGFTLVELLVVIAIIVVLAAAGFGAGNFAMKKAKTTASRTYATALTSAVEGFYSTYNSLPNVGDNLRTDRGDGVKLLEILLGIEPQGGRIQNTRNVKFLEVKETKTKARGLLYRRGGRNVEGLYDDFGNPFYIELDKDYEERLRFNRGSKRETLNGRRVAVYSAGADKQLGTEDDITTW
ncbi:MAG: prepilin-type N-terminal cleavage/methylation domain-containing protein [Akkermansiaceae bacterium]|jgi:prepilin-type N-terminal cleavage/methylation domain-containing protein|nr:prepilin-type N-terminal cleavage/methylation domain-containing protein [Akkermansiaceae bacterium]